ncbi:NAD(P)/FAD-dependent oxidoreductase [Ancylobacter defluvii]|uniref:Amino acid dehydrogenase n=1 Tax=Ancylobacter defluvii TaxID=1282440 RepID=A0A9W6JVS0_9HYPH|nr:FAD-binding oxidoreductase [Ancylobacter defluvii]MBS7589079.1 FAD-binding oxidoreductase [Ancylobacter defluvii]GLK84691.1 amino acid dehydrogenase [Ancylobacter defluvii]
MSRILVIGAGIVGLSCARALHADGHEVTVLDRDPPGDKCSFGNAAGIGVTEIIPASVPGLARKVPGWLFDPLGPLSLRLTHFPRLVPWLLRFLKEGRWERVEAITASLATLSARTYDDMLPLLAELDLMGDLHKVGALWVYETRAGLDADLRFHQLRRRHGLVCEELTGEEARELEPALAASIRHAIMTPQWSHVSDPKRIVDRLRLALEARGVAMIKGEVAGISGQEVVTKDGRHLPFERLVVAAGAWSGRLARQIGDRALIESERGYNTTLPSPGVSLSREVIFAERAFVATPIESGLRIGGAAEFAGLDAAPNYARSDALAELGRRFLPGLNTQGGTRWMGHRPTTADSLPVIGRSPRRDDVFYAFGHGHTGLTFGPTTGRLIAELVAGRQTSVDVTPFAIQRFS